MEYNLTAWKLACDVWATGESCTPAHGLYGGGGGRVGAWEGKGSREHNSPEGGRPAHPSSAPIPEQPWQAGNHAPREVFPNEMDPICTTP